MTSMWPSTPTNTAAASTPNNALYGPCGRFAPAMSTNLPAVAAASNGIAARIPSVAPMTISRSATSHGKAVGTVEQHQRGPHADGRGEDALHRAWDAADKCGDHGDGRGTAKSQDQDRDRCHPLLAEPAAPISGHSLFANVTA